MTTLRLNRNAMARCIDCGDTTREIDGEFVGRFEGMMFWRFECRACRLRWANHMPTRVRLVSSGWIVHWWIAMHITTYGNDRMTPFRAAAVNN